MAALERAVPRPEPHGLARGGSEHLDLDVLGPFEVSLQVHAVRAEPGLGLPGGGGEGFGDLLGTGGDPKSPAASAPGRLDRYGVSVRFPEGMHLPRFLDRLERTGHH